MNSGVNSRIAVTPRFTARASSYVSDGTGRYGFPPVEEKSGPIRMKVAPTFSSWLEIWYCIPCTSETTATTAATPIITPRTVRTERILFAPIARRAIFTFSKNTMSAPIVLDATRSRLMDQPRLRLIRDGLAATTKLEPLPDDRTGCRLGRVCYTYHLKKSLAGRADVL